MTIESVYRAEPLDSGSVVHVWSPTSPVVGLVQLQFPPLGFDDSSRLVPLLVSMGWEVSALDLPSIDGSIDLESAVAEHLAARRELLEQERVRERERELPIVAVGHGVGALITAASVSREPAGVRRMVLTAPVFPRRSLLPGRPLAADADVFDRLRRETRQWSTPTTIIHGTDDAVAPYARSEAFVRRINRPDVVLTTIEGGRHALLHDTRGDITTLLYVIKTITKP